MYTNYLAPSSGIVLSKIYANSMMVLVNSRAAPEEEEITCSQVTTVHIGTLRFGSLAAEPTATTTTTTDQERQEQQEQQLKDTPVAGVEREEQA